MDYLPLFVLATILTPTWKYEKEDYNKINSQSQKKNRELEKVRAMWMEQNKEPVDQIDKLKLQLKKNYTKLKPEDRLFFKPAFTALSLNTVFSLILIHTFGVGLVGSISTVSGCMSMADGYIGPVFSFILMALTTYKCKRERAELVKTNAQLQKESLNKNKDREDVVTTLMEVKTELENQRSRIKVLLEEVERDKEVNKQKLQAVEITEREMTFDKQEELLREKENLLRAQWKLDQTKKDNEKQLLNTERLLEPIEILVTRTHGTKEVDMQI